MRALSPSAIVPNVSTQTPMTVTRRTLLREAGLATAALSMPGVMRPAPTRGRRRPTVAVLGGGIAGLTAAHELAERGFEVTVYEGRAWGGKARSTKVPRSGSGGRRPLPGEHGFRIEFGFYQNLPDTLRRIPFGSNPNGAFDNLVGVPQFTWARAGARDLVTPIDTRRPAHSPEQVVNLLIGLLLETDLPPQAVAHFAARMAVFMSSCDERRLGQWENTSWTEFIGADRYSDDYRKLLGETYSQVIQASKAERTSARFSAVVVEHVLYALLGRGANGPLFRIFDAPTNEAWIWPWVSELRRLGVRLRNQHSVTQLECHQGRIVGARVQSPKGARTVRADWYVCALPVERARRLWTRSILAADPHLERMRKLDTGWMNGIQFYLRERTPVAEGHVDFVDAPWLVSSISQAQFWDRDFARTYGDGGVHDCLSAISSCWTRPGVVYGKAAQDCTPRQIAVEVWEQMKRHLNDSGRIVLRDELVHSWRLDPGLVWRRGRLHNQDPLVLPTVGHDADRPDVATAIPNLFLAGDYLKSDWLVANMETANYNGRRAVNALLAQSDSSEPGCAVKGLYRPPEWDVAKRIDADRYRRGEPNLFDRPLGDQQLRNTLARLGT